jgi:hypothetical protein
MFSTPNHIRASFRNFGQKVASCPSFFFFVSFFYGLQVPLFFNHHFSFKASSGILFFCGHMLREPTCKVFFLHLFIFVFFVVL